MAPDEEAIRGADARIDRSAAAEPDDAGPIGCTFGKTQGVKRPGEEAVNGRPALKYRYRRVSNTNTQAGTVNTEAFFFVDKETGLPLRSELYTEASGDVQGVKGAKVVAEMRNISTIVDPSLFEVPLDYKKVPPEQVRQQINALTNAAMSLLRALMSNAATSSGSPAVSPTPALSVSPR